MSFGRGALQNSVPTNDFGDIFYENIGNEGQDRFGATNVQSNREVLDNFKNIYHIDRTFLNGEHAKCSGGMSFDGKRQLGSFSSIGRKSESSLSSGFRHDAAISAEFNREGGQNRNFGGNRPFHNGVHRSEIFFGFKRGNFGNRDAAFNNNYNKESGFGLQFGASTFNGCEGSAVGRFSVPNNKDRYNRFGGGNKNLNGNSFGAGRDSLRFMPNNKGNGDRFNEFVNDHNSIKPSFVPTNRHVDEIFDEDAQATDKYLQIREDDDDIVITNSGSLYKVIIETWSDANFDEQLMKNINRSKYTVPRKIQSVVIPLIIDKHDVKGHAETGSGKTAAFLLPIINIILTNKKSGYYKSKRSCPFAIIIEPTRELAIQLYEQAQKFTCGTDISVAKTYGKYRVTNNLREISIGCDILIGTPGRLCDFFTRKYILVNNIKFLVMDEADQLLQDSFMRDLRDISDVPGFPTKKNRQTLLFSATFPPEVQKWANEWLKDDNFMVSNRKPTSANSKVIQKFEMVSEFDKKERLLKLLKEELNEVKMTCLKEDEPQLRRTLVFVRTKRNADVIAAFLCQENIKATTINGDRSQEQREKSLNEFRKNEIQVVVSTDVCARGIDIKDLNHVINCDLPDTYVTYVHRIGRTGRLAQGVATSFFDPVLDTPLSAELIQGLRNANQELPQFLLDASENKLDFATDSGKNNWYNDNVNQFI